MGDGENPYLKASQDAAKEFNSRLFWLSGGAITLTFAFASGRASSHTLVLVAWLIAGVSLLIGGLLAAMVSHQFTIRACNAWYEYQNVCESEKPDDVARATALTKTAKGSTDWVKILNWAALVAVASGVACVSVFLVYNLSRG